MRRFTLFIILFGLLQILSTQSFSQDLVGRYTKYFPATVLDNPTIREAMNEGLKGLGEINPFIIPKEIVFADNFFSKNIRKPEENGSNEIKTQKEFFTALRSEWSDSIVNIINKKDFPYLILFRLRSTFRDLHNDDVTVNENIILPQLTNFDYYIVYCYFLNSSIPEYDSKADYNKLMLLETDKIVNSINNDAGFFKVMQESDQQAFLDKIIYYHYLFTDKRFNARFNFSLDDLIGYSFADNYKMQNRVSITGALSTSKGYDWNIDETISHGLTRGTGSEVIFNYPYSANVKVDYLIGINYTQSLRKNVGILSYIKAGAHYAKVSSENKPLIPGDLGIWVYRRDPAATYYKLYSSNRENNVSASMFDFYAAVPVYYVSRKLHVEAGLMININKYSVSHSFTIDDKKDSTGTYLLSSEIQEQKFSFNKTEFSFLFTIYYDFLPNAALSLQTVYRGKKLGLLLGTDLGFNF